MINGQGDLDVLLGALFIDDRPVPHPYLADTFIPVFFGVAEEDLEHEPNIPGLRFAYQYDMSLENIKRVQHQPWLYIPVEGDDGEETNAVQRIRPPTFRRLVYEIDLLTHSYRDMVELSERVFERLQREYGHLTDADDNEIVYRLDGMTDMTRKMGEERLFRRVFTYSFDAWVLEGIVPIGDPLWPIETVKVDIYDKSRFVIIDVMSKTGTPPWEESEQEDP